MNLMQETSQSKKLDPFERWAKTGFDNPQIETRSLPIHAIIFRSHYQPNFGGFSAYARQCII
jgi:hypothetical protein